MRNIRSLHTVCKSIVITGVFPPHVKGNAAKCRLYKHIIWHLLHFDMFGKWVKQQNYNNTVNSDLHIHTLAHTLCTKVIKVSQQAARCQSSKLLHHSARWYLKPIHRISRPWLPLLGAVPVLLLICSLSHRNRKEERETDGKAGEWRARDTMLTAPFLLLLILSPSVSPLCSAR